MPVEIKQDASENGAIPVVSARAEQRLIGWLPGTTVRVLIDGTMTGGRLSIVEIEAAQPYRTPVHVHHGDDELFLVREGSIRVWVDEQRYDAGVGATVYLPREHPHAYAVVSQGVRLIAMTTSGALPELFGAAGWDLRQPVPEGWQLTPQAVAAAARQVGHDVIGPPLEPDAARITRA